MPSTGRNHAVNTIRIAAAIAFALGAAGASAQTLSMSASPQAQSQLERHASAIEDTSGVALRAAASARAVLAVLEGRVAIAAVSVTYEQAMAAARGQAAAQGKPFDASLLRFHEITAPAHATPGLGLVTLGAPSGDAQRVIMFLRTREARAMLSSR
jgi:hypothetical protein